MDMPPSEEELIAHFLHGSELDGELHEEERDSYDIETLLVFAIAVITLTVMIFI